MKLFLPLLFVIVGIYKLTVYWLFGIDHYFFSLEQIHLTVIEIAILIVTLFSLKKAGITDKEIPVFLGVIIIIFSILTPIYYIS